MAAKTRKRKGGQIQHHLIVRFETEACPNERQRLVDELIGAIDMKHLAPTNILYV